MSLQMIICSKCRTRCVLKADGTCPACGGAARTSTAELANPHTPTNPSAQRRRIHRRTGSAAARVLVVILGMWVFAAQLCVLATGRHLLECFGGMLAGVGILLLAHTLWRHIGAQGMVLAAVLVLQGMARASAHSRQDGLAR